ncbi:serine hydrolase domain-containing protein [Nonomuraea sp. NPDC050663]|uniref:serine hydrolase domain-containing protein n=1 Tax=Nonomuraea sp. NPDC050663 TaxID=3364370 RepID=UPI0037B448E2
MNGHCDPRFARVREIFEKSFAKDEEVGAAVAVYLNGEPVVDLWDGVADRHTGRPWAADTPAYAYSCTKAITATVLLTLVERGLVEVSRPVATYWPEFGKPDVTVEHLLTHQAGLPIIDDPVPVEEFSDHPAIAARLAAQEPIWEPGSRHGYHALTYGFLLGEVIRRVSGKSVGELVAAEIAGTLGLDMWLGAPDHVIDRAARLTTSRPAARTERPASPPAPVETPVPGEAPAGDREVPAGDREVPADDLFTRMNRAFTDPQSPLNRALGNPDMQLLPGGANHPAVMASGWPAAGVVTTARALAGFYRALVAGEILQEQTLRDAIRRRVSGPDELLIVDSSFGLGYMRPSMTFLTPPAGHEGAFGHTGMGGFLGLGDVEHGLAFGYTPNRLARAADGALRGYLLLEASYQAL